MIEGYTTITVDEYHGLLRTIREQAQRIGEQAAEIERLRKLAEYLDDPQVLLTIPQPHRLKLSELLHVVKESEDEG